MASETVGIKQVAELAGVSIGTVSNVLNRPSTVSDATRRRVQKAIDELGFVRNWSASRLRSTHNTAIGLVVLDTGNPFFTETARGVEEVASEAGYTVMLCNSDVSFDREERHLRFLAEQRVAGILITPWAPQTRAHLDQLRRRGVKIVLIDEPANAPDQCSVSVDDVMGGEIAGNYLLGIGRRRIAYLNYREPIRQFDERLQGLRRAIENHPDRSEVELLEIKLDDMKSANGFGATSEVLKRRPDAAFCANDLIALGLMRGLVDHGVRIPEDIAMIGYDDIEFSALAPVPLSSIRQPTIQMGRAAMRLLLEECTGSPGHAHSHVVFSPELVVRASTEPVAR